MQVNNARQAKVKFLDLEDNFVERKAFWFPMRKNYIYNELKPRVGDIVNICFKYKNEKHAMLESISSHIMRTVFLPSMVYSENGYFDI